MATPGSGTASLSGEEMARRLTSGAALYGDRGRQAAAHLLVFTDLMGRRGFARHVQLYEQRCDGGTVPAARVRDWPALLADDDIYMTGGTSRLVKLAAALEAGVGVDLRDVMSVGGRAHIRRIVEAVMIATGAAEERMFTLAD